MKRTHFDASAANSALNRHLVDFLRWAIGLLLGYYVGDFLSKLAIVWNICTEDNRRSSTPLKVGMTTGYPTRFIVEWIW